MKNEPTISAPTAARLPLLPLVLAVFAAAREGVNLILTAVNASCQAIESPGSKTMMRVLIVVVGMLSLAIGSASAQMMSQGKRIEVYLQFAFGASDVLRKFVHHPQATLICPSGKCEKGVIDQTWLPVNDNRLIMITDAESVYQLRFAA
jgi:hypothetical protein